MTNRGFIKGQTLGKLTGCVDGVAHLVLLDLEESLSHKEVQFKKFCRPVKTSYPPAENINETPGLSH